MSFTQAICLSPNNDWGFRPLFSPLVVLWRSLLLIYTLLFYQILTGTRLHPYRQRFSDGQEESFQYYCCQIYQGTECSTYAWCDIYCLYDYLYLHLQSPASSYLIWLSSGCNYGNAATWRSVQSGCAGQCFSAIIVGFWFQKDDNNRYLNSI